ncbi:hypothetical protein EW053_27895 [Streptomyces sp. IB2014 016-6]|nr:hypothetical protein EW053_27895 [Streptomyces sp. IB2014 016-6]
MCDGPLPPIRSGAPAGCIEPLRRYRTSGIRETPPGRVRKVPPGPRADGAAFRIRLGPVFEPASGSRRLARTSAALSDSPEYARYGCDPPSCDRTHRTP